MPALRQRAAVDRLGKGLPTTRASMSAANGCLRWTNCSISTDAKTSGSGCEGSCRAHDFRAEDLRASAYRRTKSSLPLWQTEATTTVHTSTVDVMLSFLMLPSCMKASSRSGRTIRCRPSRKRRDAGEVSVNFVVAVPVFAIHHRPGFGCGGIGGGIGCGIGGVGCGGCCAETASSSSPLSSSSGSGCSGCGGIGIGCGGCSCSRCVIALSRASAQRTKSSLSLPQTWRC